MTELNTLLGLPKDFPVTTLQTGETYTVTKDRERAFPLHIAILIVDSGWNFYGYAEAISTVCKDQKTTIEFKVLTLFEPEARNIYKEKFITAAKLTGEVK